MAQLRTRKDGGCSLCTASDENVGKRRCCHVLDANALAVRHEKGMYYVDISGTMDKKDVKITAKANEEKIQKFFMDAADKSRKLSKKEKADLNNILRNMF